MSPYDHFTWRGLVRAAMAERGWTQRDLAHHLGMSQGNVSSLLSGRRGLQAAHVPSFCAALDLDEAAATWFSALVDLESPNDRARQSAELAVASRRSQLEAPSPDLAVVQAQADWRVMAVQELALCDGFRPDPAWIAQTLEPEITPEEAAEVLRNIFGLGLLREREDGGFEVVSVRTPSVLPVSYTDASRRLQTSVFELIKRGWGRFHPNERHGGIVAMALSEDQAERMLQRLRELEQEFVKLALDDPGPRNRVYVLTTQWTPVSTYTDSDPDG